MVSTCHIFFQESFVDILQYQNNNCPGITLELQTTEKKYCKITSFHGTRAFAQRQKM